MKNSCKKVVINGSMLDEKPTGAGIFAYNVINNLIEIAKNYEVTIYASTNKFLNKKGTTKKIASFSQAASYKIFAAMYRFLWNQINYFFIAGRYSLSFNPTTHGSIFRKNQIITILDLLSLRYDNISFHQKIYFKYFLPLLVKNSRKIITISNASKKDIIFFLKCPPEKIDVVYCGYDKNIYKQYPLDEIKIVKNKYEIDKYIIAVGPTFKHKNFEKLFLAYKKLSIANNSSMKLVIAGGKKNYIQELKSYAENLQITDRILFLGYIPLEDLARIYSGAVALVYPSLYEGFGLPPLEAMASGCPVIVSNTSSLPEVCGEAAVYVNPLDVDSIKEGIQSIIYNEETRQEYIMKGLVQCKKFSWEISANLINQIINENFN